MVDIYGNPTNPMFPNYYNPWTRTQGQGSAAESRNNGIIWVQGIEGAKAWQLSPNSNALLMDSENEGRFYIKTSDNVGMCNLRIFDYTEVTNIQPASAAPQVDLSNYVTKEELQEIISALKGGTENGKQSLPANDAAGSRK